MAWNFTGKGSFTTTMNEAVERWVRRPEHKRLELKSLA